MDRAVSVSDEALKTLRLLADELGTKIIVGCAIDPEPQFVVDFLQRVEKIVGLENVISIEVGNEPDHLVKQGRRKAPYTYEMFVKEMEITVEAIKAGTGFRVFEGPAYAGCNTFPGKECWEKTWLDFSERFPDHKYISFHRYAASGCSPKSNMMTLLEDPQPTGPRSFEYVEELRRQLPADREIMWGEGNTFSCGSLESDASLTFGATLWVVDVLLESSVAGVGHVNFHGIPYNKYTPFERHDDGVEIRPLYYGMLFVTKMLEGGNCVTFKPKFETKNPVFFKIWGVLDTVTKDMRIVLVNKDLAKKEKMTVAIDLSGSEKKFTKAILHTLTAPSVEAIVGIKYNEYTFDGNLNGLFKGVQSGPLDLNSGKAVEIVDGKLNIEVDALKVVGISLS